ncbi:Organic hydroperoxide resistance protein [Corynebacterium falsenii DSM 44353]|uniref:organic hydroperoxide resistance protein n=1 Tax=Corynebacterium falsenii TaxID=108486 RepID=UPI0003E92A65|nr:organic hydroperoxide resistance protein [Corynebacterium falsenii]AHI04062.1 Organic hydroperoxide resistance protein [Corynebacterium falsenii DSM 44353]UBI04847.1 organic hydroperoxide resistance protein [Corynebacterium falsenii]UBI07175.1 organic hydroperoxide resistance protein [Corynebacterium falsenii]
MSEKLYTAKALSTGGGRDGHVATDDRQIDLDVRPPKAMGGSGEGTNPEQLVAAGWAACFNGALQHTMKSEGVEIDKSPEVVIECSINKIDDGFKITAAIQATVFGVDQETAEKLVSKAHQFCPYSRAFRGNVDPEVTAIAG